MRLLVVGKLNGQLSTAVKMAMSAGAKVSHVETIQAATHALRAGQGADLLMVDYVLDIAGLIAANEAERIRVPVVACGVAADAAAPESSSLRFKVTIAGSLQRKSYAYCACGCSSAASSLSMRKASLKRLKKPQSAIRSVSSTS